MGIRREDSDLIEVQLFHLTAIVDFQKGEAMVVLDELIDL